MIEFIEMFAAGLVDIIFAGIGLIVLKVVLPWVEDVGLPWLKDKHLWALIEQYVAAAEKNAESGFIKSDTKKEFVLKLLQDRGIAITPEVDAFIEAAVEKLDLNIESGVMVFPDIFAEEIIEYDGEANAELYEEEAEVAE